MACPVKQTPVGDAEESGFWVNIQTYKNHCLALGDEPAGHTQRAPGLCRASPREAGIPPGVCSDTELLSGNGSCPAQSDANRQVAAEKTRCSKDTSRGLRAHLKCQGFQTAGRLSAPRAHLCAERCPGTVSGRTAEAATGPSSGSPLSFRGQVTNSR